MRIERVAGGEVLRVVDARGRTRWVPADESNRDFRKTVEPRLDEVVDVAPPRRLATPTIEGLIGELADRLGTTPRELRDAILARGS